MRVILRCAACARDSCRTYFPSSSAHSAATDRSSALALQLRLLFRSLSAHQRLEALRPDAFGTTPSLRFGHAISFGATRTNREEKRMEMGLPEAPNDEHARADCYRLIANLFYGRADRRLLSQLAAEPQRAAKI